MQNLSRNAPKNPRKIAGALLFLTGALVLMGIITAEIFYPTGYTTSQNEISDLGATRPPNSVITQPSATIFNATMLLSGMLLIVASYFIDRGFHDRLVTGSLFIFGIGLVGVGVFPGNVAAIHPLFALLSFVAAGIAPLMSSRITGSPFRYIAILLGAITLLFLILAFFFGSLIFPVLGDGGTERWIAYPAVIWVIAFGGFILGRSNS